MAYTLKDGTVLEYRSLTLEQMKTYIEQNVPASEIAQAKEWFKSVAMEEQVEQKAEPVWLDDAKTVPAMTKPKFSKKTGKWSTPRQKVKFVDVPNGKVEKVYNHMNAVKEFCTKYCPELLPVKKDAGTKPSASLLDW